MTLGFWRAAALAAVAMLVAGEARALSFDERWKSLFADSEVSGDRVAAKAEMVREVRKVARPQRAQRQRVHRHRAYRHRSSTQRSERRREWYKGGKKWHYVTTRKRR